MSTGISISSINRIKELAEEKKYAEALEILDTQDLDKSINPQFLRISGEIFRENKRYYDSRRILLRAHQMAPQGLRIIYELIQLYLELGYFSKAEKYYEQYLFYTTPEDTQKEYVEYLIKKAKGENINVLASILLPILERMPEDRWNFEAVLVYDKIDRKDKALEEAQYILENYKDSIYVKPVIDYIDDKLDVDQYWAVYPKYELTDDRDTYGDLIDQEEEILKKDYLAMYPPEAKIMVEAEDKEAIDVRPVKEKKSKKKKKTKADDTEDNVASDMSEDASNNIGEDVDKEDDSVIEEANAILEEERIRKERESALEKLLSKRVDTEQVKESAKQIAEAVKNIDTSKAKNQVKNVAETVKKATETLGEAVGVTATHADASNAASEDNAPKEAEIVDGIIESVLEPPKKTVGQVVTNEELDAIIPDSLEAMSTDEIAELEAKKAEEERLELEALEAQMRLEEEKKAKRQAKRDGANVSSDSENILKDLEDGSIQSQLSDGDIIASLSEGDFARLREQFLAEQDEDDEEPLPSLGYISVVQSDVDSKMEEMIPDAADMLHQMIDNKEFYTGEDSRGFESKASYENHGFEIEDYDFETFTEEEQDEYQEPEVRLYVEGIYAKEDVVDFEEMIPNISTIEEEARKKAEEEARRKADEEARRKAEKEARMRAEEEARRKAEEEERIRAEEEARKKAEEEARLKAEEEKRRKAEEEAARLKAMEEARQRAEEEAKQRAAEVAKQRAIEEAEMKAIEEARLAEEERKRAEEEARLKAEEEARLAAEEARRAQEAKRRAEEEKRRRAEEEARLAAEEEARRAEEERRRLEEEARRAEEARIRAEEEARLKAEEEARLKAEEEARRKAEEEAKQRALEEKKRLAEEEARLKAEEEARLKAEEEMRRRIEEEERLRAEEEERLIAEAEARRKAELSKRIAEEQARLEAEEAERLRRMAQSDDFRERLRFSIIITDTMTKKLAVLKESR